MKTSFGSVAALGSLLLASLAHAHTHITYPEWRGDNIIQNSTFPFGMQWMYPCGGLNVTTNRTHWPLDGGAIAVQPGFNAGHQSALMYINLGLGEEPANYTTIMVPMFHLTGPTNNAYPGTFCLPDVPLPRGVQPKEGDMASIQVVQAAAHGATVFSCADIIFTGDNSKIQPVNGDNCFNTTGLKIEAAQIETNPSPIAEARVVTPTPTSGASRAVAPIAGLIAVLLLV